MTRSRRKTPVCGNTTTESEKQDKWLNNRRIRRAVRVAVLVNPLIEVLPDEHELSSPWQMGKDGKSRFDPEEHPELMRK